MGGGSRRGQVSPGPIPPRSTGLARSVSQGHLSATTVLANFSRSCSPPAPLPALQGSRYSISSSAVSGSPTVKAAPRPPVPAVGRSSNDNSKRRSGAAPRPIAAAKEARLPRLRTLRGDSSRRHRGRRATRRCCHSRHGQPITSAPALLPRPRGTPPPPGPGQEGLLRGGGGGVPRGRRTPFPPPGCRT